MDKPSKSYKINYPKKLFDTFLYILMTLMIDILAPKYAILSMMIISLIRFLITYFINFYSSKYLKYHRYYILMNIILLLNIFLAIDSNTSINTLLIIVSMVFGIYLYLKKPLIDHYFSR